MDKNHEYEIYIDGDAWNTYSEDSQYDAIHAVAGAILGNAKKIEIIRTPNYSNE